MAGKKIKNKHYRNFLDNGIIDTIGQEELKQMLKNVKGRHVLQGRALLAVLYYTGCRPAEALDLRAKDFTKERQYVIIRVPGRKGGLPRKIYLKTNRHYVKELWDYASSLFDDMLIFFHFRNSYKREVRTAKGLKVREETTDKLRYYFKKWSEGVIEGGISPYFLRHNRFSRLAEAGLDLRDIRMLKGSRTVESITPYIHLSTKSAKKISRNLD